MKFYKEETPFWKGNGCYPCKRKILGKIERRGDFRVDECEQSIPTLPPSPINPLQSYAAFVSFLPTPSLSTYAHKEGEDTTTNRPLSSFSRAKGRRKRGRPLSPIFSSSRTIMRSKIRCITHESRAFKCFNWFPCFEGWSFPPPSCFFLRFSIFGKPLISTSKKKKRKSTLWFVRWSYFSTFFFFFGFFSTYI